MTRRHRRPDEDLLPMAFGAAPFLEGYREPDDDAEDDEEDEDDEGENDGNGPDDDDDLGDDRLEF